MIEVALCALGDVRSRSTPQAPFGDGLGGVSMRPGGIGTRPSEATRCAKVPAPGARCRPLPTGNVGRSPGSRGTPPGRRAWRRPTARRGDMPPRREGECPLCVGLSEGIGADDFAAGLGGEGPPGRQRDGILDELDRPVEEPDIHAAGVVGLGVDHRDVVVAGGQGQRKLAC